MTRLLVWLSIGALSVSMTWGFSVYAYGRWGRISGFARWADCNDIVEHMRLDQPEWVVKDCDLDAPRGQR